MAPLQMTSAFGRLLPLALVTAAVPAGAATARHGVDVSASVALTETYDDNVFAVSKDERPDMVSRLTPQLGVGYRSARFDLRTRYSRDAESFRRSPELSTWRARQEAGLDLRWSPGGGFEAAGSASYVETHSPGEFAVITGLDQATGMDLMGLELRRALANRLFTAGTLSQRLGARTRVAVAHGFSQDEIVGGVTSRTHVAGARLDRQVGPVDAMSFAYGLRRFTALGNASISQTLTVAWVREVTPHAHLELKAGPRLSGRTVGPELAATLRHRFRRGAVELSYMQTETAVIGRATPVTAEGLSATFTRVLTRTFTVTAGPNVFRARGKALDATVYGTTLNLAWRLSRHLSLGASHQLSLQYGELDGIQRGEIVHNTVLLRLVAGSVD